MKTNSSEYATMRTHLFGIPRIFIFLSAGRLFARITPATRNIMLISIVSPTMIRYADLPGANHTAAWWVPRSHSALQISRNHSSPQNARPAMMTFQFLRSTSTK